jgi:hypothetical protein
VVSHSVLKIISPAPEANAKAAITRTGARSASIAVGIDQGTRAMQAAASGRWGFSLSTVRPPINPPTLQEARISAHAPAPPRSALEIAAPSTKNVPLNPLPTAAPTTITQTQVRELNSVQPSRRSRRKDCGGSLTRAGSRSPARQAALTRNVRESRPSAQPAPTPATSPAEIAGPAMPDADIEMPRRPFASCSRSGLTTWGVSPVAAGLKNAVAIPCNACNAAICQISACPEMSRTAVVPWVPSRIRSAPIITARRGSRSANTPPISKNATSGTERAANT